MKDHTAFDEIIRHTRWLYNDVEQVYEVRDTYPHYVELDEVLTALSNARGQVERAKEAYFRVVQKDTEIRRKDSA